MFKFNGGRDARCRNLRPVHNITSALKKSFKLPIHDFMSLLFSNVQLYLFVFFVQFPICDGSHSKHNEESGDNVGPLVIRHRDK